MPPHDGSHDVKPVTGGNVALIEQESGLEVAASTGWQIISSLLASRHNFKSPDFWRLPFLKKLLEDPTNQDAGEEQDEAKA